MKLTQYTDYSLRALMYMALHPERLVTITEIAEFHGISRNHMVKVIHQLGVLGYVQTQRGKNGGLKLAMAPETINVGEVIRKMEPGFGVVECFNEGNKCVLSPGCKLKKTLGRATELFLNELGHHTLADLVSPD